MIDEKFTNKQKKIIEADIKRLEEEIKSYKKYANIGSTNEDSALEFEAFEEKLALSKAAEKDLKELKKALQRTEEGKYGICQKCGEPIEPGRLKMCPAATLCATHANAR